MDELKHKPHDDASEQDTHRVLPAGGWTGVVERLSVLEAISHLRGTREFKKGFGTEIRNLILASSWANSYFERGANLGIGALCWFSLKWREGALR
jgi:hypothetical protein